MTRKHTLFAVAVLATVTLLVTACGGGQPEEPESVTIGVVNITPVLDPIFDSFKEGIVDLGYVEGENVTYIYEGATGSVDGLQPAAQRLLEGDSDLIVAITTPAAQAAKQATAGTDVPVVFITPDPIAAGIVEDLSQPGGNLTGVSIGPPDARRLEWLLEIAPNVERVFVPYNPEDPSVAPVLAQLTEAASDLGLELVLREARNDEELTAAIESIPQDVDAIFIPTDTLVFTRIDDFIEAARERRLPISTVAPNQVEVQGALVAFGYEPSAAGRQMARIAGQVLQGVDPAGIPVETAEFFLYINLQTADTIGLDISDEILRQAESIIR